MMHARRTAGLLMLLLALALPAAAQQSPAAGRIKLASGTASIVRAGAQVPATVGEVVFEADALRTGTDGRLGVTLKDETRISLAPNSEVRLDRFLYAFGGPPRVHAQDRARAHGVRVGTHRPTRARCRPTRNADGHRRRARDATGDPRRGAMTRVRVMAILLGTSATFVAPACGPRHVITRAPVSRSLVVLLADPDSGAGGRATVSNQSGSVDLVGERDSTEVAMNQSPRPAGTFAEAEVQRVFGEALAALPPSPQRFILQFQFDSDELTAEGRKLVPEIIRSVGERSAPEVDVVGHTDTTGTPQGNFELGMKRAATVRELLLKAGLDVSLIDVQSHGESEPLVRTADNTYEPRNRRVEVAVR